jgi:hypothetical protein
MRTALEFAPRQLWRMMRCCHVAHAYDEHGRTAAIDAVFLASMGLEFRIIMESRRSPEQAASASS